MQQFNPNPSAWGGTVARTQVEVDQGLRAFMLGVYNNMVLGLAISALVALGVNKLAVASGPAGAAGRIGCDLPDRVRPHPLRDPVDVGGGAGAARLHLLLLVPDGPHVGGDGADDLLRLRGGDGRFALDAPHPLHRRERRPGVLHHGRVLRRASPVGYTTSRSLSAMGSFLIMGLIGLILASIVNIFLRVEHAAVRASRCSAC